METKFYKTAGVCLLVGAIVMVATMVLHPVGGSLQRILAMYNMIIVSHSMAMIAIPFVAFGFYGLSKLLQESRRITELAFTIVAFSMVAVLIGGVLNGFALPFFVKDQANQLSSNEFMLVTIVRYGFAISRAMDYLFIAGTMLSVGIWSMLILRSKSLSRGLGWLGIVLITASFLGLVTGFNFLNVSGFTVFVLGLVSWIVLTGLSMIFIGKNTQ